MFHYNLKDAFKTIVSYQVFNDLINETGTSAQIRLNRQTIRLLN